MNLKKVAIAAGLTISLFTIAGIMSGAVSKLDNRYAKADLVETVKTLSMRLDIKILEDRLNATQERIWTLEARHGDFDDMPISVKEEYRGLKKKMKDLEKEIENSVGRPRG